MSYLDAPRINFTGVFQADPSTVNNDVRYYDNEAFRPEYQQQHYPGDGPEGAEGYWNPEGTGIFRFIECKITGAQLGDQLLTSPEQDPVIGLRVENADRQAPGKIVDLDPQMQYVSQLWGVQVRLASPTERALFCGDLLPVALMNLWRRQLNQQSQWEQPMAASYQSILHDVAWQDGTGSPVLEALRAASEEGLLSINFNLYGYTRDNQSQRFTMGLLSGSIGPCRSKEPKHFVMGRHLTTPLQPTTPNGAPFPTQPLGGVYGFQCVNRAEQQTLYADFGLALPITNATGQLHNIGTLTLALLIDSVDAIPKSVSASQFAPLGTVDYLHEGWYTRTAGIQGFCYAVGAGDSADDADNKKRIASYLQQRPLLLLGPQQSSGNYPVLTYEAANGQYARADGHVFRLNPDQPQPVDFYASQFGKPLATSLYVWQLPPGNPNSNPMGGTGMGDNSLTPPVHTPQVGFPEASLHVPDQVETDFYGKGTLTLLASPPLGEAPRGYIDGQLYALSYDFQPPPGTRAGRMETAPGGPYCSYWNFVSLLVFNKVEVPQQPTWERDIQPILQQYGNLYPIMSRHLVDLGNYESVRTHRRALLLAFSLPPTDPNYMPVSRDLSDAKREMLLSWLSAMPPEQEAQQTQAGQPEPEIIEIELREKEAHQQRQARVAESPSQQTTK
ncbi:hypothetical protein [Chromobacterium sphagni]|uniref:Uncharacterized protein n=1 Tax=Chromobacterium sphagni TaxID=1903179 RepID=A0ABX3CF70_9NEIS|nr:hypothetical protein [Chromobacterium sphagni]OHX20731.1 hypothetical protein BI344_14555 [Chromobacterium sphagni]